MKERLTVSFDTYHNSGDELSMDGYVQLVERIKRSTVGEIARENLRIMKTETQEGVVKVEPRHAATMAASLISNERESIVSVKLLEGSNEIEIIRRIRSDMVFCSIPSKSAPDEVWKEVYGVVDGKITMIRKVRGVHQPIELRGEVISFPKDD